MAYSVESEIKARMKAVGLTARDLANILREPPGTVSNRLNGFIPLSFNQRRAIVEKLNTEEQRKRIIEAGEE
jgi:transcriptional regulator with XRE-family HTH domain